MSWCHQCGVTVTDGSDVCPLCQCVLEPDNESEYKYPDIGAKNQVLKLITRIYLFLSIVIQETSENMPHQPSTYLYIIYKEARFLIRI